MNKDWLERQIEEIDLPKDEIYAAIAKGMEAGKKEKYKKKRKKVHPGIIFSSAASLFLASGFIFSPITNVLAQVPVLGSIYENFASSVGTELFSKNLVTSLNQEATSNGVEVTITSSYFDGNVIGITFKANGEGLSLEHMDEGNRPASGYNYHLFDGLDKNQWVSSGTELKETGEGFIGAIEFYHPNGHIPKNFTLPIAFTHMADIEGKWKFDVPVEQIPGEKISAVDESNSKDGAYTFKMNSIIKGKATTLFEYETIAPSKGKEDDIEISVFDNNGNRLAKNSTSLINSKEQNGVIERSERELFTSKIDENAGYLMIYPEIRQDEEDTIKSMNRTIPFQIESNRFEYKVNVTDVKTNGKQLTLDYYIKNVDTSHLKLDIIQNFAGFIQLIHSNNIKRDHHGEPLFNHIVNHSIQSKQTKLINKDELHFQSTFEIDTPNKFDYEDYSLMVPFGTLSSNAPIGMDPIKINLKN